MATFEWTGYPFSMFAIKWSFRIRSRQKKSVWKCAKKQFQREKVLSLVIWYIGLVTASFRQYKPISWRTCWVPCHRQQSRHSGQVFYLGDRHKIGPPPQSCARGTHSTIFHDATHPEIYQWRSETHSRHCLQHVQIKIQGYSTFLAQNDTSQSQHPAKGLLQLRKSHSFLISIQRTRKISFWSALDPLQVGKFLEGFCCKRILLSQFIQNKEARWRTTKCS